MKLQRMMSLLALITLGLLIFGFTGYSQRRPSRTEWEYKVTVRRNLNGEEELNQLGREGWELVAITGAGINGEGVQFYLKRARAAGR